MHQLLGCFLEKAITCQALCMQKKKKKDKCKHYFYKVGQERDHIQWNQSPRLRQVQVKTEKSWDQTGVLQHVGLHISSSDLWQASEIWFTLCFYYIKPIWKIFQKVLKKETLHKKLWSYFLLYLTLKAVSFESVPVYLHKFSWEKYKSFLWQCTTAMKCRIQSRILQLLHIQWLSARKCDNFYLQKNQPWQPVMNRNTTEGYTNMVLHAVGTFRRRTTMVINSHHL